MSIFGFLFIGLIAGWLAGLINNSRGIGLMIELLVGVIGALLGGFFVHVHVMQMGGFFVGLVTAAISAILALALMGVIKHNIYARKSNAKQFIT